MFFEYAVELGYPVSEIMVGSLLTFFNTLIGGMILFLFFIPNIGTVWMNYALVLGAVVSIPAVLGTKGNYLRLNIDVPILK